MLPMKPLQICTGLSTCILYPHNIYAIVTKCPLHLLQNMHRTKHLLPPTDTRLRPDLLQYENGMVDESQAAKTELEEIQRTRRRYMEVCGCATCS